MRVSEQESKMLLCQLIEKSSWYYSVETPTENKYRQKGKGPSARSGRSDISLYKTHHPGSKRAANVELKAHGKTSIEDFRKDFEKVLREGLDTLWFHTLENTNSATFATVFDKMHKAFGRLKSHIDGRSHSIVFAFCVLERKQLWLTSLKLSGEPDEQLKRLEDALDAKHLRGLGTGGWRVHPQPTQRS